MNRTTTMRSESHGIKGSHGPVPWKRTRLRRIAHTYTRSLRILLSTPRSQFPFPIWSKVIRRVALALADEAIRSYERGNCREGQRLLGIVEAMAGGISASVARAQRARIEPVPNKRDKAIRDQSAAVIDHTHDVAMPREGRDHEQRHVEGRPIASTFGGATWSYQQAAAPALQGSKPVTAVGWAGCRADKTSGKDVHYPRFRTQVTPPQEGLASCVYCLSGPRYFSVAAWPFSLPRFSILRIQPSIDP